MDFQYSTFDVQHKHPNTLHHSYSRDLIFTISKSLLFSGSLKFARGTYLFSTLNHFIIHNVLKSSAFLEFKQKPGTLYIYSGLQFRVKTFQSQTILRLCVCFIIVSSNCSNLQSKHNSSTFTTACSPSIIDLFLINIKINLFSSTHIYIIKISSLSFYSQQTYVILRYFYLLVDMGRNLNSNRGKITSSSAL